MEAGEILNLQTETTYLIAKYATEKKDDPVGVRVFWVSTYHM